MYFCVVTREMVDSCRLRISAISRNTIGRIATSPCSKKWRCRSTIACDTRRIVSNRCWTLRISHFASCNCEASNQQLAAQLQEAKWLIRNVQQRGELLVGCLAVAGEDIGVDAI